MRCFLSPSVCGQVAFTIDTSYVLGKGAQANVYKCFVSGSVYAAKIFHKTAHYSTKKIEQMIANPPKHLKAMSSGLEYHRYAWPLSVIKDAQGMTIGMLMPMIDLDHSHTLDFYYDKNLIRSLNSLDEVALSYKVEIAANLSSAIADLHSQGHYFVDFKPQNVRVFMRTHEIALIDCDGFSINGVDGKRYPADLFSADYICPEAYKNRLTAKDLGEDQDRYALAVIIFQLLNGGIHPFQGVLTNPSISANTNDEKAAMGLYPHGKVANDDISPRKQSIHHLFDEHTSKLFEQAFTFPANLRPSAQEWADHLNGLLLNKSITRCVEHPYDVRHMKFGANACPECYLSGLQKSYVPSTAVPDYGRSTDGFTSSVSNNASSQQGQPESTFWKDWGMWIALGVIVFIGLISISTKNSSAPSVRSGGYSAPPAAPPAPSAPAAPPAPPAPHGYLSVYFSDANGYWAWVVGAGSQATADKSAKSACQKPGNKCIRWTWGTQRCLAIAKGGDWSFIATGDSLVEVENSALKKCWKQNPGGYCQIEGSGSGCSPY